MNRVAFGWWLLTGLLLSVAFVVDLLLPLGVAAGILHCIPQAAAHLSSLRTLVHTTAVTAIVLIVVGYFGSPSAGTIWVVLANRALSILMVVALWAASTRVLSNVSELAQKSEELLEKNRLLEHADRSKTEFLRNISHELRTPLSAVIGFSQMLHDEVVGPLNAQQKDYCAEVLEASTHLLTLINDLLDLSKLEAGKMELQIEESDLADLCRQSISLVSPQAAQAQIELRLVPTSEFNEPVYFDQMKVRQLVVNLLANAIKFTPAGGRVELRCRSVRDKSGHKVVLSVVDTGVGIAEEDLQRIFMPFEQVKGDPGRKHTSTGTGLGLTLVSKLAELHGGRVLARSELGKGSEFTVELRSYNSDMPETLASQNP